MPLNSLREKSKLPYEEIGGNNFNHAHERDNNNTSGLEISIDEDDNNISMTNCCLWCKERFCTKEKLKRRLPLISWLPKYSFTDLKGDLLAGITIAFTIIPQALAYAVLAGLPPQYGLYTSFIGCFMYTIFGTSKDAAVGPTSILAILVTPYVASGGVQYAVLLSFMSGVIMFLAGLLNLGFIIDFVSFPVMSSFTSAAAITIIASQFKGLTGLHYNASRFLPTVISFFQNVSEINFYDLIMGTATLCFLLPVQMFEEPSTSSLLSRIYRFIRITRNVFVVIICGLFAAGFHNLFTSVGHVSNGLPPFKFPVFTLPQVNVLLSDSNSNITVLATATTTGVGAKDTLTVIIELLNGSLVISLIALLETIAVVKVFSSSTKLDATQELFAIGICNIMGSFVSAFPVTGSFCRSAVNHLSGVRTQLGGSITGALVIVALVTVAPLFEFIPKAALSAIIISAVIPMICISDVKTIWRSQKLDIIPYLSTFLICLFLGLEYGIFSGALISFFMLLYQMARPRIATVLKRTPNGDEFLYVKPDRNVFFPSVEYMKVKIRKALPKPVVQVANLLTKRQSIVPVNVGNSSNDVNETTNSMRSVDSNNPLGKFFIVVIDCEYMFRSDTTFAIGIRNMVHDYYSNGLLTIFYNLRKSVYRAIVSNVKNPDEFFHCTSEEDIYKIIYTHRYKVETAATEDTITEDDAYEQVTDRYWMSNSFDGRLYDEVSQSSSFKV